MNYENLDMIIDLRHDLHRIPELSMMEYKTMDMIRSFLEEHTGLEIVIHKGWMYAVKKGVKDLPPIAFRADMDALPIEEKLPVDHNSCHEGRAHKCGHDGHCAALCGLALELDQIETARSVYLIFQPGEETGQGAKICRSLIREKGIAEIYAIHNLSGYPENSFVYRRGLTQPASEGLQIRLSGKTSHASAPEEGRNPAAAISHIVLKAKELAESRSRGMVLSTVTGIQMGSGDFGISPGEGELCLTIRAEYEDEMKLLEGDILSYAKTVCTDEGLSMEYAIRDYFPETRNHDSSLEKALAAAKSMGLHLIPMKEMWRASEDFGWYLKECPGAIIYIGNGVDYPGLHTGGYDFNDHILETAVDLFVTCTSPDDQP